MLELPQHSGNQGYWGVCIPVNSDQSMVNAFTPLDWGLCVRE